MTCPLRGLSEGMCAALSRYWFAEHFMVAIIRHLRYASLKNRKSHESRMNHTDGGHQSRDVYSSDPTNSTESLDTPPKTSVYSASLIVGVRGHLTPFGPAAGDRSIASAQSCAAAPLQPVTATAAVASSN